MDRYIIKKLIDSCFVAKKITEAMLELPKGMKPRHIHVIDCINQLEEENKNACVSDVSSALNITTPSVTKLINELERMNLLVKKTENSDKRIVTLSLTESGRECYKHFVVDYHSMLAQKLNELSEDECRITIQTIEKLYKSIESVGKEIDSDEQ